MSGPKHVREVGRWRIAWRWGRYRTGWHRNPLPKTGFSFGLPFLWVSAIRRNKRVSS